MGGGGGGGVLSPESGTYTWVYYVVVIMSLPQKRLPSTTVDHSMRLSVKSKITESCKITDPFINRVHI